ncbi:hypothetical protein NIES4075_44580 [Tolypothrix sp. NIES-4075]|uniref:hypothetical protein n=1 Tax=Tolypothrix sp. NIES-4075 TaxID=2005459 RepID=UPI000B5C2BC3|nr:hypothetical protein [Tolypothrix sp. NIES-4075]GAX43445.1 hypothetical protein NIES4075_44580 [Tolypothrix sp. NIES-4075]
MSTITDDIGVWNLLGSVIPVWNNWLKFPNTATGTNATLRLSYLCPDWKKLNSYLLLRPRYQTSNTLSIGIVVKIYPEIIPNLIEVPIPQDLQDRSIYFRDFEIKKVSKWRRRVGITPDVDISVKLEELWG